MSLFLFLVLAIVALAMVGSMGKKDKESATPEMGRMQDELFRLRERVNTLERIVTDSEAGLSRDIRKL